MSSIPTILENEIVGMGGQYVKTFLEGGVRRMDHT